MHHSKVAKHYNIIHGNMLKIYHHGWRCIRLSIQTLQQYFEQATPNRWALHWVDNPLVKSLHCNCSQFTYIQTNLCVQNYSHHATQRKIFTIDMKQYIICIIQTAIHLNQNQTQWLYDDITPIQCYVNQLCVENLVLCFSTQAHCLYVQW